jgi:hypothetical protein
VAPWLRQGQNKGVLDPFGALRVEQRKKARSGAVAPIKTVEEVGEILKGKGYGIYDPARSEDAELRQRARHLCRDELSLLLKAWADLNEVIDYCKKPEVGFARLVTSESRNGAKERWTALQSEGYLYRKRLTQGGWFQRASTRQPGRPDRTGTLDPGALQDEHKLQKIGQKAPGFSRGMNSPHGGPTPVLGARLCAVPRGTRKPAVGQNAWGQSGSCMSLRNAVLPRLAEPRISWMYPGRVSNARDPQSAGTRRHGARGRPHADAPRRLL